MLYSVWLCKTAGWEGPAQVLDWSRLSCQSSQRPATERPPRNRLHRVHGPRHLAPGSLQRRPQPGAGVTPQHSHRWGGLAFFLLYMSCFTCVPLITSQGYFTLSFCLPFYLRICRHVRTWSRVVWNSLTFEGNFSYYASEFGMAETAVRKGRTAPVVMTGLANCSSLLWHTRMAV